MKKILLILGILSVMVLTLGLIDTILYIVFIILGTGVLLISIFILSIILYYINDMLSPDR